MHRLLKPFFLLLLTSCSLNINAQDKNYNLGSIQNLNFLTQEAYQRMKIEINGSHILLFCNENASPADTLAAYNKLLDIRKRALKGENFDSLASKYSEDPSAKKMGAKLGWYTVFQMVYPFENQSYKTAKGDISMPFRTQFGYHILKVNDKRPARGEVKLAHIMIRTPYDADPEQIQDAQNKVVSIYAQINNGESFGTLAKKYSQDATSENNGEMSWIASLSGYPDEFKDIAFSLTKDEVSKPFKTNFGFHIIKLIDKRTIENFEEVKEIINKKIEKDSIRSNYSNRFSLKQDIQSKVEQLVNEWQQKGKYEKTADYLARVNEATRNEKIKEAQRLVITSLGQNVFNKNRDFVLGDYDADNESYLIKSQLFGNMLIKVPINKAQSFEKDWDNVRLLNPQFSFNGEQIVITKMVFAHNADSYLFDISKEVKFNNLNIQYNFSKVELEPIANLNKASNNADQKQLMVGKSDIDLNIPTTSIINNNGIAVIIGNSNYSKTAKVDFALNDARLMKEYLIKTLGYKEGNILYYENIGLDEFNTIFGTKGNARGRLSNIVKQGISDVFIYYVGHGAPGINDGKGYFVPVGCDPNYVENGGYQLDVFYENLSQIKAKSITVVTDACFSGADIFKNISPIGIKMKDPVAKVSNISVFSSSSGTEVSSWYNEKGHGMFTYFFLKAIQDKVHSDKNKDGVLTYQEVYEYLSDNNEGVPYYARSIHNVQQNPTLEGDRNDQVFIKFDK